MIPRIPPHGCIPFVPPLGPSPLVCCCCLFRFVWFCFCHVCWCDVSSRSFAWNHCTFQSILFFLSASPSSCRFVAPCAVNRLSVLSSSSLPPTHHRTTIATIVISISCFNRMLCFIYQKPDFKNKSAGFEFSPEKNWIHPSMHLSRMSCVLCVMNPCAPIGWMSG